MLLQKFYAEGDIQKKRNRGELPQYLFTDVHEAIIDRDTFRLAQEERKRRGEMYRNHVLGYRLENGSVVVDTVGAETVRYIFKLYLDHEEYTAIAAALNAKGYKTVRDRKFTNKTAQAVIVNDFYDPANPAVTESILDQKEYSKKREAIIERYNELTQEQQRIAREINDREVRRETIKRFRHEFEKLEPVDEFDELLWVSMLDKVTVCSKERIVFRFRDGSEVSVGV